MTCCLTRRTLTVATTRSSAHSPHPCVVTSMTSFTVLDERERDVLERRNGYDGGVVITLDDIGKTHKVTRERIRQVESTAY